MKTLNLNIDSKLREAVPNSACVGVEIMEFEGHAVGTCIVAGSEGDCHTAYRPGLLVVPAECLGVRFEVWDASYVRDALEAQCL